MAEEKPQPGEDGINAEEQLVARFEKFGTTPPRTRLRIKIRDWDRKQRIHNTAVRSEERYSTPPSHRKITLSSEA